MNKRENWAEKFERQKDENEEFVLNLAKQRQLEEYNGKIRELKEKYSKQNGSDYKTQIVILKEMLEAYCKIANLEIKDINVRNEIRILQENINYLKFKQQYIEEYKVDEVDVRIARAETEMKEIYEEENLEIYRKENSTDKNLLKMKEESDRSKDSQSWEEYKKEEEREE